MYSITLSQGEGNLVSRQAVALAVGVALAAVMTRSNYRLLQAYAPAAYTLSVLALAAVLAFGVEIRGTVGWFALGSFHFQPVEFAKVALILMLASYFSRHPDRQASLRVCIESALLTAVPVALTLLQPDLGSALLLLGIWGVLLLFSGIKKRFFFLLVLTGLATFVFAWTFVLADYQQERLLTFVDPARDPAGKGYNVRQALIAVGSGGWLGRGLGFGSQSQLKFIPESQTDFIFAVIAEELGFVGVVFLLGGFFLFFQRILHHASSTNDDFTGYLLLGIGIVFFLQCTVNIGMNIGLLPVTGITLPFVSYGGSSLMLALLMVGIVQSVSLRRRGSSSISLGRGA